MKKLSILQVPKVKQHSIRVPQKNNLHITSKEIKHLHFLYSRKLHHFSCKSVYCCRTDLCIAKYIIGFLSEGKKKVCFPLCLHNLRSWNCPSVSNSSFCWVKMEKCIVWLIFKQCTHSALGIYEKILQSNVLALIIHNYLSLIRKLTFGDPSIN